jgi:hypothetical protein
MTSRLLRPLAGGFLLVSVAACASIVSDSKGPVTISSNPTAAEIAIVDQSGVEIYRGTTPATITLDASAGYFDGQEYTVTFSKDGYDPTTVKVDSTINGWYVGNIVFGGFIGWLIVDPLTGAMWALGAAASDRFARLRPRGRAEQDDPGSPVAPAACRRSSRGPNQPDRPDRPSDEPVSQMLVLCACCAAAARAGASNHRFRPRHGGVAGATLEAPYRVSRPGWRGVAGGGRATGCRRPPAARPWR